MCHELASEVARKRQETRNEETKNFFQTFNYTEHGDNRDRWRQVHTLTDVDINNNPQETWGRTDYMKGDITGNTWDEIKIQTETN